VRPLPWSGTGAVRSGLARSGLARTGFALSGLALAASLLTVLSPALPADASAGVTAAARAAGSAGAAAAPASGPDVSAVGADLVNLTTGRRLWSRGLDRSRPIASITKVMTALVVLRAGHLSRLIRVSASAVAYAREHDASTAGLHVGDVLTARQLLEGLLLPSGADAAYLLAHAYARSGPAFVARMNETARGLGMKGTHFANYDGLPWPSEYSTYATPRALLLLARAVMERPTFRAIVSQRRHWLAPAPLHHGYAWRNTNLLLRRYRGAVGIKTGFTSGAGYCLLFAARRGGQLIAGVVLDSSSTDPGLRFSAAAGMLRWGFRRVH
jgi:serine-type D-Ala-D-Ala carboxypeptidase (penicillin-binding protein 5/6)